MTIAAFFDVYNLKARQAPATIAIAPVIFAAFGVFPELRDWQGMISGLLATLAVPALLSIWSRRAGKRQEARLYERWGGKPSMAMLRHRDERISPDTKRAYHEKLRSLGRTVPTAAEELADPAHADQMYEGCGDLLRRLGRDHRTHQFIFAQNIAFGFARNLSGLKPVGIALAVLSALVELGVGGWKVYAGQAPSAVLISSFVASVAILAVWLLWIDQGAVRDAAESYARALLEICDDAPAKKPSTRKKAENLVG